MNDAVLPPVAKAPMNMERLKFASPAAVHQAYMPFLRHGGLFVVTDKAYRMGDAVVLLLELPEGVGRQAADGVVAWINPPGGHRPQGVGIAFSNRPNVEQVRHAIEKLIVGLPTLGRAEITL